MQFNFLEFLAMECFKNLDAVRAHPRSAEDIMAENALRHSENLNASGSVNEIIVI